MLSSVEFPAIIPHTGEFVAVAVAVKVAVIVGVAVTVDVRRTVCVQVIVGVPVEITDGTETDVGDDFLHAVKEIIRQIKTENNAAVIFFIETLPIFLNIITNT